MLLFPCWLLGEVFLNYETGLWHSRLSRLLSGNRQCCFVTRTVSCNNMHRLTFSLNKSKRETLWRSCSFLLKKTNKCEMGNPKK